MSFLFPSSSSSSSAVVENVANRNTTLVFVNHPGACPNRGGLQFAIPLFSHYSNKNMMSNSVENVFNRSCERILFVNLFAVN